MDINSLKVACLQINSSSIPGENFQKVENFCKIACENKVKLLVTPENICVMPTPAEDLIGEEGSNVSLLKFKNLAKIYKIWIVLGSLAIKDSTGKIYNRSYLINNEGNVVASYDKIHLFSAKLSKNETYSEMDCFSSGNQAVLVKTDFGTFGMTICYDLRFPDLYRELARQGAQCFFVPSAFTKTTGEAHWENLLKARAIENGCYVFAPNQVGVHADGKETFGHSMIISPWGETMAILENGEGIIIVDVDLKKVDEARSKIPSLSTSLPYSIHIIEKSAK